MNQRGVKYRMLRKSQTKWQNAGRIINSHDTILECGKSQLMKDLLHQCMLESTLKQSPSNPVTLGEIMLLL